MQSLNTKSTGWPETIAAARTSNPASQDATAEIPQTPLGLLADLESCLRASQSAVLGRDVERLEKLTAEQDLLRRALAVSFERHPPRGDWLHAASKRVLHLGRVQLLLLLHAQQSLQVLVNIMAGSEAPYAPRTRVLPPLPPRRLSSEEV